MTVLRPDTGEAAPDPKAEARREAQRAKRETKPSAAIRAGLNDLAGWISDQLRAGLAGLLANLRAWRRQVAARMVEARMGALVARVDEIPARIQALPAAQRTDAPVAELGNLVLITRAWGDGSAPDPGLRRQIATTETRDALLADPNALRVTALWSVCAAHEVTRREGLVAQSTWLASRSEGPAFALLQDHFLASARRRSAAFAEGDAFGAELVFYPSAYPLLAQIVQRCEVGNAVVQPVLVNDPLESHALALGREPWVTEVPLMLPEGRLAVADDVALGLPLSRAATPGYRSLGGGTGHQACPLESGSVSRAGRKMMLLAVGSSSNDRPGRSIASRSKTSGGPARLRRWAVTGGSRTSDCVRLLSKRIFVPPDMGCLAGKSCRLDDRQAMDCRVTGTGQRDRPVPDAEERPRAPRQGCLGGPGPQCLGQGVVVAHRICLPPALARRCQVAHQAAF